MRREDKTLFEEKPFEAKREAIHDESHGEGGHGGTEMGWLVSYADMMTLLFGLFVILFSLKTDGKHGVDEVMRAVSKKYFTDQDGKKDEPSAKGDHPAPKKPDAIPEKSAADDKPQENPTEKIAALQASLDQQKKDYERKVEELNAQVDKEQQEKTEFQQQKKSIERKFASLQQQEVKKDEDPSADLKKEVESLKDQLEKKKADYEKMAQENEKNKSPHQNYMMVLLTWETEKHDVDLQVATPHKKVFNFKRRQIAGEPGSFELDSRYGPGIEMWKAENFTPGAYTAKINLYNKNGNEADARIQLTVVTNLGTYKSGPITLGGASLNKDVPFNIDAQGSVQFGN